MQQSIIKPHDHIRVCDAGLLEYGRYGIVVDIIFMYASDDIFQVHVRLDNDEQTYSFFYSRDSGTASGTLSGVDVERGIICR